MPLYFVRHAKAGNRSGWNGPDEDRPLTKSGREQADGLARLLAEQPIGRVLSSPYVRCLQTVEPLAHKVGVRVEPTKRLAEGGNFDAVIELLHRLPDHSVLCSHGDVIPETIDALVRRGMAVHGEPDWRKGSYWILDREDGDFVSARAIPPPA